MIASIFIEPHERYEAVEAYADRLTTEQRDQIEDAPEGALINLQIDARGTKVIIINEG